MIRLYFKGYMCNNVYSWKNNEYSYLCKHKTKTPCIIAWCFCLTGSYLCTRHMLLVQSHIVRRLAGTFIAFALRLATKRRLALRCAGCATRAEALGDPCLPESPRPDISVR